MFGLFFFHSATTSLRSLFFCLTSTNITAWSALSNFIVLGVRTNIGFMQDIISQHSFLIGDIDTDFLKNIETIDFPKSKIDDKIIASFASASDYIGVNKISSKFSNFENNEFNQYSQDPFQILDRNFP